MQYEAWENEYKKLSLVTGKPDPQKDVIRFLKWLKKQQKITLSGLKVLDLGSGTGRNTNYLQSLGNDCVGMEISKTANNLAITRAQEENLNTKFLCQSIGDKFPFKDAQFDLLLDVVSSNSLNDAERKTYLVESNRVLKENGHIFVKALCKDGDKNAHNLLKSSPSKEKDTYLIKEINLFEHVFARNDFLELYGNFFNIIKLSKKTTYTRFNNRSYKRNFWVAYLQKKS